MSVEITRDFAEQEFDTFCKDFDINVDVEYAPEKVKDEFEEVRGQIITFICEGSLRRGDEGWEYHFKKPAGPRHDVTFVILDESNLTANDLHKIDKHKSDLQKGLALTALFIGQSYGFMNSVSLRDNKRLGVLINFLQAA